MNNTYSNPRIDELEARANEIVEENAKLRAQLTMSDSGGIARVSTNRVSPDEARSRNQGILDDLFNRMTAEERNELTRDDLWRVIRHGNYTTQLSNWGRMDGHGRDTILNMVLAEVRAAKAAAETQAAIEYTFDVYSIDGVMLSTMATGGKIKQGRPLGLLHTRVVDANRIKHFSKSLSGVSNDSLAIELAHSDALLSDAGVSRTGDKPKPRGPLESYDILGLPYDQAPLHFVVVATNGSTVAGMATVAADEYGVLAISDVVSTYTPDLRFHRIAPPFATKALALDYMRTVKGFGTSDLELIDINQPAYH